jgi:hypothetical protein
VSHRRSQSWLYLNNYYPLASTDRGEAASKTYELPPFIDGSIRREPDLQHRWPAISRLCRPPFAVRLEPGDHVVYLTVKGRYGDHEERHRRLTAILRAVEVFATHEQAAAWYRRQGHRQPSNCMVNGNPPMPLTKSHMHTRYRNVRCLGARHDRWDAAYRRRAAQYPQMVRCKVIHRSLWWDAPVVHDADLIDVFGKVPCTQNPGAHPMDLLEPLTRRLRIGASPSSR